MPEKSEMTGPRTGKWDEAQTAAAVERYLELTGDGMAAPDAVKEIASETGRTPKSVTGKLVSEKVYVAPVKKPAEKKDEGPTKGEILTAIKGMNYPIDGLDSATKPALHTLHDFVASVRARKSND